MPELDANQHQRGGMPELVSFEAAGADQLGGPSAACRWGHCLDVALVIVRAPLEIMRRVQTVCRASGAVTQEEIEGQSRAAGALEKATNGSRCPNIESDTFLFKNACGYVSL